MTLSVRFSNTKSWQHAIACCLLLLTLPSCGIPPRREAQKPPPLPESFAGQTSAENSSQLGIVEFYHDPKLLCLIDWALAGNRELKILNEDVQIASNQILARSGAYLPFLSAGPSVGLDRVSNRTIEGAALRSDPFLPGRFFANPHGNYLLGTNFTWQMDIYRQLRNARDAAAQRYVAAIERRNSFQTRLVADIAEDYFRLMALDKRLENLNQIIAFVEQSLTFARARKAAARDTELAVLRFEAEVRRNQSEKLIVNQDIIEAENRINFLANRFPGRVERDSSGYFDLTINTIGVGVPSQLLQNRPDIRRAERELAASGLDVKIARANFFPQLVLNAGVGIQSFNLAYLFEPQAVIGNIAAGFIGPLVNRRSIRADYLTSNARQLQAIYDYQRTILEAFTDVVNRLTEVQNYGQSVTIRKEQLSSLEQAVGVANQLFQFARTEYLDVLTAQRDLRDARTALIDTKQQQLTAVVRAYQALGGGTLWSTSGRDGVLCPIPHAYKPLSDKDFRSLSGIHYGTDRYDRALQAALHGIVPYRDDLNVRDKRVVPPDHQTTPRPTETDPCAHPTPPRDGARRQTVALPGDSGRTATREPTWPVRPDGEGRPWGQSQRPRR